MRVALAIALLLCGAAEAQDAKPGIVGSDDRVIAQDALFSAVGRLNLDGRGFCTATLIAPRLVMTAAHCLWKKRSGKAIAPENLHFVAAYRKGKYRAHRRGRAVKPHPDFDPAAPDTLGKMASDIALVILDEAIPESVIAPIPLDREPGRLRMVLPLTLVSYARDRAYLPSVEVGCVVRHMQGRLLFTDCDSNFGVSGAPVLTERGGVLRVLGVVSGIAERNGLRRTVAVKAFTSK